MIETSNPDIFAPYERLVEIKILGRVFEVPENNTLLRCFQYLSMDSISQADLCWNGECLSCQVWIKNGDKEKGVISCRTKVDEGMEIVRLSDEIDLEEVNI
ncbi:MAG: 2Fe-2S iron-sulfur cluster-binding protein [Pyrinomonadaceae bacterium]